MYKEKILQFESFISSPTINFYIIVVTETWPFDNEVPYIKLNNYSFIGTQRPSGFCAGWHGCQGGGGGSLWC